MMSLHKMLPLALVLLVLAACNKDDYTPVPTGFSPKLVITIQDQFETPPSRVSVFFKVENQDGDPVAGLTEENFTIYEKGRNDDQERLLSVEEAARRISDNSQVFQNRAILLLDLSGSVLNTNLPELKDAANKFIDKVIIPNHSATTVGIWWFDGRDALHQLIDFTDNAQALHSAISGIDTDISTDNSTDLFGAIIKSTQLAESKLLETELQDILGAVSIVTFTDGTDQAARYARADAYKSVDNAPDGVKFYTIGLGSEIDETVLKRIGKTSFVYADDTDALTAKFEEIANLITDEANAYYLFEYCTPKRDGSGLNELHIEAKQGEAKGRKITSFDATGFSADCDL